MRSSEPAFATLVVSIALLAASGQSQAQEEPSFTLKYGVLAVLTGDPASSGQAWNEAAKLGINQITQAMDRLALKGVTVELTDSQDSQGSPQPGVEAAQKLVNIDGVDVIIGDFYSSVTSAVATAVAMPNQVLMFTGGTSPALTKLNTGTPALLWQPVPADDVQGRVLARIIAEELGADAKINVAARNDAYGTALAAVFEEAWTEGGGTIQKLALPLNRTGAWDPARSFGSDTLNDCSHRGAQNWPGMKATRANASAGESFPAFREL